MIVGNKFMYKAGQFKSMVQKLTRAIQYFLSLVIFCILMYNWDLFHLLGS